MTPEIQISSGGRFNFENPMGSEIYISDIATALSKECRFSGHCRGHYSVAQHSVLVSHIVPEEYAMYGLLHDASEAYMRDISAPLKQLLPEYKVLEHRIQGEIYYRFGLTNGNWAALNAVHDADMTAVLTEKRDLMPHDPEPWMAELDGFEPLGSKIVGLERIPARKLFMDRFMELN